MTAFEAVSEDVKGHPSRAEPAAAPEAGPQPGPELEEALRDAAASVNDGKTSAGEAPEGADGALADAERQAADFRDRWMRTAADLENYRRRAAKDRDEVQRFGIEKLLKDFLPVLDDLDRTLSAVEVEGAPPAPDASNQLLDGVRLVHKKFLAALEKHGVSTFESVGQAFNPERHEAIQQAHAKVPQGAVASELQRGFLIHDRLLRAALVVVSLGPASGENDNTE